MKNYSLSSKAYWYCKRITILTSKTFANYLSLAGISDGKLFWNSNKYRAKCTDCTFSAPTAFIA